MHIILKTKSCRARCVDGIRGHAVGPDLLKRHRQAIASNAVSPQPIGAVPETGVLFRPAEFGQVQDEGTRQ